MIKHVGKVFDFIENKFKDDKEIKKKSKDN